jgi:hypothetical protein
MVKYQPVRNASPEITRYAVLLSLALSTWNLFSAITERGHASVEVSDLRQMSESIRTQSDSTLATARREIDISCACCRQETSRGRNDIR